MTQDLTVRETTSYPQLAHTMMDERNAIHTLTQKLIRQAYPRMSAGRVIVCVVLCREELVRTGVRAGLASATERRARARLGLPAQGA
jgi:hypothetical protein